MDQEPMDSRRTKGVLAQLWQDDRFETGLLTALIAGLAWAPFWLGSDRLVPWGINGVLFPSLAVLYESSLLVRGRRHPVGMKFVLAPTLLFAIAISWMLVQMSTWSPPAIIHPIWTMASSALGTPLDGSISVNRSATALAMMRLLTDASVFWLALQLCRDSKRAILLLRSISAIVAAYALYGLLLTAFTRSAIPFFDTPETTAVVRSTFVNRNNFATYAGLGLVTTVGLLLRMYRHEVPDHADLRSYRLTKFIEATGRRGWVLIATGLIILAALLGSVSRGGILAAILGCSAVLIFSMTRKRRRRSEQVEAILFTAVALVAGFVVFGDLIVGRISNSGFEDLTRMAIYQLAFRAILDVPVIGFGYGTFADIFPLYRDGSMTPHGVLDMAHNSYLEVFFGLGLIFGGALIAAIVLLSYRAFHGALTRQSDATPSIVATAAALLVGVHALVDFSLEIEAVALTFAALLGAGVAGSASSREAIAD